MEEEEEEFPKQRLGLRRQGRSLSGGVSSRCRAQRHRSAGWVWEVWSESRWRGRVSAAYGMGSVRDFRLCWKPVQSP